MGLDGAAVPCGGMRPGWAAYCCPGRAAAAGEEAGGGVTPSAVSNGDLLERAGQVAVPHQGGGGGQRVAGDANPGHVAGARRAGGAGSRRAAVRR
jgi:hypothetical protein